MWNSTCRTSDWNQLVRPNSARPAGWRVPVGAWPANSKGVMFLDGSGTEPTRFGIQWVGVRWLFQCEECERQPSINDFRPVILDNSMCRAANFTHNRTIGLHSTQKCFRKQCYSVLTMRNNGAWTTYGLASGKMQVLCGDNNSESNYRPPIPSQRVATTSLPGPEYERQWSVNNFRPCILE